MKTKLYIISTLLFASCSFPLFANNFQFKKNTQYSIEYQLTDQKTKTLENVYFQRSRFIEMTNELMEKESQSETEKTTKTIRKKFIEVIKNHNSGKREIILIDGSKIISIALTIKEGRKKNPEIFSKSKTQSKKTQNEELVLKIK